MSDAQTSTLPGSSAPSSEALQAAALRWRRYTDRAEPRQAGRVAEQIIALLEPSIKHVAGRFHYAGVTPGELHQAGRVAVLGALERYRPERGAQFATYVRIAILGSILNYGRDQAIREPAAIPGALPATSVDPRDEIDRQIVIAGAIDRLPPTLSSVLLRRHVERDTLAAIAEDIGRSPSQVSNIEREARRMVRVILGEDMDILL